MVEGKDSSIVPDDIADKMLHRPHLGILHIDGNGFDGLSFQRAHLPRHVLKEMVPRLLSITRVWENSRPARGTDVNDKIY